MANDPDMNMGLILATFWNIVRFIPARCLHIGMLIACIMGLSGPGADDESGYVVTQPAVNFTARQKSIQKGVVAMAVLCLIFDPILAILFYWANRKFEFAKISARKFNRIILFAHAPWYISSLAGWIVCIVFQASFVPILGSKDLELCSKENPLQCKMISASWILSFFFCADHLLLVVLFGLAYRGIAKRSSVGEDIVMWPSAPPDPAEQSISAERNNTEQSNEQSVGQGPSKIEHSDFIHPPSYRSRDSLMKH